MNWKAPHISKIYEALTAIADGRVQMGENVAKVYSSSRGKYYDVVYDPATGSIASNDNTAYFTGALSYPMIAYLMNIGHITYDKSVAARLRGILWKDINQRHKNNYDAAIDEVLEQLSQRGIDTDLITTEVARIFDIVLGLKIGKLTFKLPPPKAY